MHNTGIDNGVAAISALMTYYGREHVPIGTPPSAKRSAAARQSPHTRPTALSHTPEPPQCTGAYMGDFDNTLKGPYVDDLANNFPTQVQNRSQVPDAVTVYRQVQWLWLFCREAGSFF